MRRTRSRLKKKATERDEEREHRDNDTITERGADAGWHKQRKRLKGVKWGEEEEGEEDRRTENSWIWLYTPCYCV